MRKKDLIKTQLEIAALRESGRRLAGVVRELLEEAQIGVSTGMLGELADTLIRKADGDPIFKGYGKAWGAPPFPASVCISLNDEVVHGIPNGNRILADGDLLKIDIGMRHRGMVSDMARMKIIGRESPEALRLKTVTEAALLAGLSTLHDGSSLEAYAQAVENVAKVAGFSCVRDLVGHGVGRELHEEPQIPNYSGSSLPNFQFATGMTVALEPMVNAGTHQVRLAPDGWTFVTVDGKLSGHTEDSVLITPDGYEVLTML
ncbi:MAG: type I methionyl aminopeptidase [Candidatus Moraniibacteriota bacterium]